MFLYYPVFKEQSEFKLSLDLSKLNRNIQVPNLQYVLTHPVFITFFN